MASARKDPHGAFRFRVELQGLQVAAFQEASGLRVETDVQTVQEGGVNDTEYKLPKGTRYGELTLKRGYVDDDLWQWHQQVVGGKVQRRNCSVILLDAEGNNAASWNFVRAYPSVWEGPAFQAGSDELAVESLTLVHEGLQRTK